MTEEFERALQQYVAELREGAFLAGYALIAKSERAEDSRQTFYTFVVPDDQSLDVSVGLGVMLEREIDDWQSQNRGSDE